LVAFLYLKFGIIPRPLVDSIFASSPFSKIALDFLGAVVGTRENCKEVMETGSVMMVFPGTANFE
jgi:hypothetical protein